MIPHKINKYNSFKRSHKGLFGFWGFFYKKSKEELGLLACAILNITWFNPARNNTWVITDFTWQMLESLLHWLMYFQFVPLTPNSNLLSVHRGNTITGGSARREKIRGWWSTRTLIPLLSIVFSVNQLLQRKVSKNKRLDEWCLPCLSCGQEAPAAQSVCPHHPLHQPLQVCTLQFPYSFSLHWKKKLY